MPSDRPDTTPCLLRVRETFDALGRPVPRVWEADEARTVWLPLTLVVIAPGGHERERVPVVALDQASMFIVKGMIIRVPTDEEIYKAIMDDLERQKAAAVG